MALPQINVGRMIWVGICVCLTSLGLFFMAPARMPAWVTELRIPSWFAKYWPLGLPIGWLAITGLLYRLGWIKDAQITSEDTHPELSHQQWRRFDDSRAGWEPFKR